MADNKDKINKKTTNGTPDSPFYSLVFFLANVWHGRRPVPVIKADLMKDVTLPYIVISNHESFMDFLYLNKLPHKARPAYVVNEFYCTRPFLRLLSARIGTIPKKLFQMEVSTPVKIMKTVREGYPVIIYPEGRLSPDGKTNPIPVIGASFYQRLKADLVLVRVTGAYYGCPKWRKRRYRTPVEVEVTRVIKKEELADMDKSELENVIISSISNDASSNLLCKYPHKDKAEGLHNILYQCPDCKALYKMASKGNTLTCTACGKVHTLNDDYRFDEAPFTIGEWYDLIKEEEKKNIREVDLKAEVRTVVYGSGGNVKRRETGRCRLTFDRFTYESDTASHTIALKDLKGLPYSAGGEFETYIDGDLCYFYPVNDASQVARWGLVVDIINEILTEEQITVNE